MGRLSKIVDLNRAKFKFLPDPRITFDSADCFPGLYMREVTVFTERDATKVMKKKVLRKECTSIGPRTHLPIFLMDQAERASLI